MTLKIPLIDAHFHADAFSPKEWAVVAERALASNVRGGLSAGVWWDAFVRLLDSHKDWTSEVVFSCAEFSQLFSDDNCFRIMPCIGLHPMEIALRWRDTQGCFDLTRAENDVAAFLKNGRAYRNYVWAVGETGFDVAKDVVLGWSRKEEILKAQDFGFRASVALAVELGRPLVVHSRAAWAHTQKQIQEAKGNGLDKFMVHCYPGPATDLKWMEQNEGFAGFGGVLTWPDAKRMRESVKNSPLNVLLLETDSPDLSPILSDGTRPNRNEPVYLLEIARQAAALRQETSSELEGINFCNLSRFFSLK
jgi:TatD DNase family protein